MYTLNIFTLLEFNSNMKKQLFLLFLLSSLFFAKTKNDTIRFDSKTNEIENKVKQIDIIDKRLSDLQSRYEYLDKLNDKTLNSVSNQISAASYNLTIFGILFGIAAIGIGLYITVMERKIVRISDENKDLLLKNQQIKTAVEDLNKLIQNDIYGLFLKIKREETVYILNRLTKVPQDIVNVSELLLSRDLEKDDYPKIKTAFLKLGLRKEYKDEYMLLFFQHFMYQAIKDDEIRGGLIDFFKNGINCSFENDIIKSSEDFISAVLDLGISNSKEGINKYFEGIAESKYNNYKELFKSIYEKLRNRENKFLFLNTLSQNPINNITKIAFADLIIEEYGIDKLFETEKIILEEINKIKKETSTNGKV